MAKKKVVLNFNGIAESIDNQLCKFGLKVADPLKRVEFQKLADNITELYLAGLLSINETTNARGKLTKMVLNNVVEIDGNK